MSKTNGLQDAITSLASMKFGWALLADTDPAAFLDEVRQEIQSLRETTDTLLEACKMVATDCDLPDREYSALERRAIAAARAAVAKAEGDQA